jgi:hypothetical protein
MNPNDLIVDKSGRVRWSRELSDGSRLVFLAEDVRQTSTGPHAKIVIALNTTRLDSDVFNVGRRDQRNKLANDVHRKNFAEDGAITKEELQHELMLFCDAVYPALQGEIRPVYLIGDDSPIQFLASPHVVEDAGTIIAAPGGAGKSTTVIVMALCIKYGLNGFWNTKVANPLYVNVERGTQSIERRVDGIAKALGLPSDVELMALSERGRTLDELYEPISRIIEKEGIDVVFIDSLTRGGLGDLTENKPANTFADMMNGLGTWVAIGHTSKANPMQIYGSVMYENAADIVVAMTSHENISAAEHSLGVRMDITKSNDAPKNVPPVWIKYTYDPTTNGIVGITPTNEAEFPELATGVIRSGSLADQIEQFILHDTPNAAASTKMIADHLSKQPSNISAILSKDKRFEKNTRQGREVFYHVVTTEAL